MTTCATLVYIFGSFMTDHSHFSTLCNSFMYNILCRYRPFVDSFYFFLKLFSHTMWELRLDIYSRYHFWTKRSYIVIDFWIHKRIIGKVAYNVWNIANHKQKDKSLLYIPRKLIFQRGEGWDKREINALTSFRKSEVTKIRGTIKNFFPVFSKFNDLTVENLWWWWWWWWWWWFTLDSMT